MRMWDKIVKEVYGQALIDQLDLAIKQIRFPQTYIQDPLFEIDPSWRREFHYDDCDEDCVCWR